MKKDGYPQDIEIGVEEQDLKIMTFFAILAYPAHSASLFKNLTEEEYP